MNYNKLIELDPNNVKYYEIKGDYLRSICDFEQYPEIVELYGELIELDPNNINGYFFKAVYLGYLGKYNEASNFYNKTIQLCEDKDSINTLEYLLESICEYELDNTRIINTGIIACDKGIMLDPTNSSFPFNLLL